MGLRLAVFHPLHPLYPGFFLLLENLFSQDEGDEGDKNPRLSPGCCPTLAFRFPHRPSPALTGEKRIRFGTPVLERPDSANVRKRRRPVKAGEKHRTARCPWRESQEVRS